MKRVTSNTAVDTRSVVQFEAIVPAERSETQTELIKNWRKTNFIYGNGCISSSPMLVTSVKFRAKGMTERIISPPMLQVLPRLAAKQPITAQQWHAVLSAPMTPLCGGEGGIYLARYRGPNAEMEQPALADHVLCLHLGGDKRVWRSNGVGTTDFDVRDQAITIMPARQGNSWRTIGPVDFAHLALAPSLLDRIALEEHDQPAGTWELADAVGLADPELCAIFVELLRTTAREPFGGRLYPESLLNVLAATLVVRHGHLPRAASKIAPARGGLAAWRLRRVLDFMAANLATDIGLDELTAISGVSRAHFFRAFRQSTGLSPHKFLSQMRMDQAGALLRDTRLTLTEIAVAVGVRPEARFFAAVRRRFGSKSRAG